MVWPKCLTKVFRRDRTSTRPQIHRRQAEGLQHTGPVIAAGDRLRHFCVCRPFAVQGAVTKYARSTATAASLAVYPDGRDTRCRSCRNPTGIYVRVCLPAGLPMASLRHRSSFTLRRKTADPRSRQHGEDRSRNGSGVAPTSAVRTRRALQPSTASECRKIDSRWRLPSTRAIAGAKLQSDLLVAIRNP
jgi:hypothetical protein